MRVDNIFMSNDAALLCAMIWFQIVLCVITCEPWFPTVVTKLIFSGWCISSRGMGLCCVGGGFIFNWEVSWCESLREMSSWCVWDCCGNFCGGVVVGVIRFVGIGDLLLRFVGFYKDVIHLFPIWSNAFEKGWSFSLGAVDLGGDGSSLILARGFLVDVGRWWMMRLRFWLFLIFVFVWCLLSLFGDDDVDFVSIVTCDVLLCLILFILFLWVFSSLNNLHSGICRNLSWIPDWMLLLCVTIDCWRFGLLGCRVDLFSRCFWLSYCSYSLLAVFYFLLIFAFGWIASFFWKMYRVCG